MTIADRVSKGIPTIVGLPNELPATKTLYCDYEITREQFRERYGKYKFSDNLTFISDEDLEDAKKFLGHKLGSDITYGYIQQNTKFNDQDDSQDVIKIETDKFKRKKK